MPSKPAISSQTIIGACVAILAGLLGAFGYPIGDEITNDLITVVGGLWSIWGRVRATQTIGGLFRS